MYTANLILNTVLNFCQKPETDIDLHHTENTIITTITSFTINYSIAPTTCRGQQNSTWFLPLLSDLIRLWRFYISSRFCSRYYVRKRCGCTLYVCNEHTTWFKKNPWTWEGHFLYADTPRPPFIISLLHRITMNKNKASEEYH